MRLALFFGGAIATVYALAYDRWLILAGVIILAAGLLLYDTVSNALDAIDDTERSAADEIARSDQPRVRGGSPVASAEAEPPRVRSMRAHPSLTDEDCYRLDPYGDML